MARISFSALVEEIVGKLAGSVFQDSYGGFQIRTRVSPRNPQTKYQQLRRGEFGYLSAGWRFLTDVQRQTFIDAASTPPAALNLYLQSNINLTLIEEPTITDYVPSSDPGTMTVEFYNVTTSEMTIRATGATTVVPAGTKLLLQVTYQKAPTKIFTNPSQYSPVISFDEGTDLSVPTDILTEWQSRYGQLVADKRLCLKANLIDKSNGLRGADVTNCTTAEEMAKFVKIYTNVTPQSFNTVASHDAYTFSMPGNTLSQNGDCLQVFAQAEASGTIAGCTSFLVFNGTGVIGASILNVSKFYLSATFQRIDSGTIRVSGSYLSDTDGVQTGQFEVTGLDFTVPIDIVLRLNIAGSGTLTAYSMSVNKELI